MASRTHLRLRDTMYLPLLPDGTLAEPAELRITVQRLREHDGSPKPYRLLTVHPHMRKPHLVTLFEEFVPSRRIPADVQAMVDAFNADVHRGWRALLVEHAASQAESSEVARSEASMELRRQVGFVWAHAQGDDLKGLLALAEALGVDR